MLTKGPEKQKFMIVSWAKVKQDRKEPSQSAQEVVFLPGDANPANGGYLYSALYAVLHVKRSLLSQLQQNALCRQSSRPNNIHFFIIRFEFRKYLIDNNNDIHEDIHGE